MASAHNPAMSRPASARSNTVYAYRDIGVSWAMGSAISVPLIPAKANNPADAPTANLWPL